MRHFASLPSILVACLLILGCTTASPVPASPAPRGTTGKTYEYEVFVVAIIKSVAVDAHGNPVPALIGHKAVQYPEQHLGIAVMPKFSKRLLSLPIVTQYTDSPPNDVLLKAWADSFASDEFPAAWTLGDPPIRGHCWQAGGWASCNYALAFPIEYSKKEFYETLRVTPDHARPDDHQELQMSFLLTVQPVEE